MPRPARPAPAALSYEEILKLVREIYSEERDSGTSALDVRHLLEVKLGLPHDALLSTKAEVIRAFQSLDASEFDFGENQKSRREWMCTLLVLSACSTVMHRTWWQPTSILGWLGFGILSLAADVVSELLLGMLVFGPFVKHVARVPLSRDPNLASDEIHAHVFPRSSEAQRVSDRRRSRVDHLVYACQDLDVGIRDVERATGVRPAYGGAHPGIGTHNALLSLGPDSYLEIIAPDPSQPPPPRPRPFGLDVDGAHAVNGEISAFAVHAVPKVRWRDGGTVNRGGTLEAIAAAMVYQGEAPGLPVKYQSRITPAGETVGWRFTSPWDAAGPKPFLMDWGSSSVSPHQTAPRGCSLAALEIHTTDEHLARSVSLLSAMGLRGIQVRGDSSDGESGASIQVRGGVEGDRRSYLVAWIDTPGIRAVCFQRQ